MKLKSLHTYLLVTIGTADIKYFLYLQSSNIINNDSAPTF